MLNISGILPTIESLSNSAFESVFFQILKQNSEGGIYFDRFLSITDTDKIRDYLSNLGLDEALLASDFNTQNKSIVDSENTMKHTKEDISFLEGFLSNRDHGIEFLGFEGTDLLAQAIAEEVKRTLPFLREQYSKRRQSLKLSPEQFNDALTSGMMGHIFYYAVNYQSLENISLFGFEGERLKDRISFADVLYKFESFLSNFDNELTYILLGAQTNEDFEKYDKLKDVVRQVIRLTHFDVQHTNITRARLNEVRTYLTDNIPNVLKADLLSLLELWEKFMEGFIWQRDSVSAKNLAATRKSGVVFIGHTHLQSISREIKKLCTEEINSDN